MTDVVVQTLREALAQVKHKETLYKGNLKSATEKVDALEKALKDYNDQLTLEGQEALPKDPIVKKK